MCMLASAATAQGCGNKLVGDGLASGLYKTGLTKRFFPISVPNRGIEWFKSQAKGRWYCTDTLITFIGTYDLPAITTEAEADQYVASMVNAIHLWHPKHAVWVLPGCFDESKRPGLDAASALVDGAAQRAGIPDYLAVFRTRQHFCVPPKGDGLHYSAEEYASLWYTLGTVFSIP